MSPPSCLSSHFLSVSLSMPPRTPVLIGMPGQDACLEIRHMGFCLGGGGCATKEPQEYNTSVQRFHISCAPLDMRPFRRFVLDGAGRAAGTGSLRGTPLLGFPSARSRTNDGGDHVSHVMPETIEVRLGSNCGRSAWEPLRGRGRALNTWGRQEAEMITTAVSPQRAGSWETTTGRTPRGCVHLGDFPQRILYYSPP